MENCKNHMDTVPDLAVGTTTEDVKSDKETGGGATVVDVPLNLASDLPSSVGGPGGAVGGSTTSVDSPLDHADNSAFTIVSSEENIGDIIRVPGTKGGYGSMLDEHERPEGMAGDGETPMCPSTLLSSGTTDREYIPLPITPPTCSGSMNSISIVKYDGGADVVSNILNRVAMPMPIRSIQGQKV